MRNPFRSQFATYDEIVARTSCLCDMLDWLKNEGCDPHIYRRGDKWRAHVIRGGNFWEESKRPDIAMRKAIRFWNARGRPLP